jgi:hypothetical protein
LRFDVEILRTGTPCCMLFKKQSFAQRRIIMNQCRLVEYK